MDENFLKMLASDASQESERYANLHTVFKSTGVKAQSLGARACFGKVLKYTSGVMHNTYTIITFKSLIYQRNNLCIYTKEEIEKYLNYIAGFIPFKFSVTEFERNNEAEQLLKEAHFEIFVDIDGPHIKHVFILTLIRYLYEAPYKYILLEAFRMKSIPEFSKINLLNLYNVIIFSIDWSKINGPRPTNDMSHNTGFSPLMLLTKTEINERLESLDKEAEKKHKVESESWRSGYKPNAGCIDLFPVIKAFTDSKSSPMTWSEKTAFFNKYGFKFIVPCADKETLLQPILLNNTEEKFKERLAVYSNNLTIIGAATTEENIEESKKSNLDNLRIFYAYE